MFRTVRRSNQLARALATSCQMRVLRVTSLNGARTLLSALFALALPSCFVSRTSAAARPLTDFASDAVGADSVRVRALPKQLLNIPAEKLHGPRPSSGCEFDVAQQEIRADSNLLGAKSSANEEGAAQTLEERTK